MERAHLTAWLALLLCVLAAATPPSARPPIDCPTDCVCNLLHKHKTLYHLKCNSTQSLRLAENTFESANRVHSIDLSHLNLTRLGHVLDKLPELSSVDLSHNQLHDLGHLGHHLKRLNAKHNRLTTDKIKKLPKRLQLLNLQHNNITNLPLELTHMDQLYQLELAHNPINCSCQTLQVRNWLKKQSIYMVEPVICSHPLEFKGLPWLQVKQDNICKQELHLVSDLEVTENELMMGDQPAAASGEREDEEELGKDFLPIDGKAVATSKKVRSPQEPLPGDQVEGSGDLSETNMEMSLPVPEPEPAASQVEEAVADQSTSAPQTKEKIVEDDDDDAEASGSGGGLLIIPDVTKVRITSEDELDGKQEEHDSKPVESPDGNVFTNDMGIFEGNKDGDKPVEEEVIVPVVLTKLETGLKSDVVTDGPVEDSKESEDILTAKVGRNSDDSSAIYYLLAVIGLIVVGLVLFVAIKRCQYNSSAAARDAEAQRQTELLDMDKKQLGKPLHKNGHSNGQEHSPLIGEKTKLDEAQIVKKAYGENGEAKDGAGQQPLLNGNGAASGGAKDAPEGGEPAGHEYYPISPRYPTPQSPRASKYAQQQQAAEQNNNEPDAAYLPSSPKSGRYSPVYSPETGRVKIKLTETPKPKTPMLVTRSKSNAGDIITTPVKPIAPTHQAVAININGH
ncbi:protein windpipe [Drosophila rhopaloa]|uniref:Protein windpipe n=1 Tax=Drosophila rhopaloa TaxID=1041015 RepID=A0A6P4EGE1_DRORH|nr:protein windpipe [Drosophila rhopaloa]XP_016977238.1 protein windpipe [Drosophila rhopaloa]XP_016977239.1 protein windpipe [Drosophila rhopaloa]XP_016977240.1 protein windpipe [Drosophila rhopaloa]